MSNKRYSIEERRELIELYIENGRNITTTIRRWGQAHRGQPKPAYHTVKRLVEKFEAQGRLEDDRASISGRASTSRTPELIEQASQIVESDPRISVRNLARAIGVGKSSAHTILREDLQKFPYKIQEGQELKTNHIEGRLRAASEICELIDRKLLDPMKVISSDEAHFHLCGYVNKQNNRIWASERPSQIQQRPLHPVYTTVWAAVTSEGIVDVQFIRNQKVNAALYGRILEDFIRKMDEKGITSTHWFQQDGARAHTTKDNLDILRRAFGSRIISRRFSEIYQGEGLEWPANSPDLSPMDFFVWGTTKELAYRNKPKNLDELEEKIGEILRAIPADSCRRTFTSFEERLRMTIAMGGGHIETILNKK